MDNKPKGNPYKRIKAKINELLKTGLTPQQLALALAGGIILGSFPLLIPGVTTLLCISFAVLFRLNLGFIQLVNLACSPLQILLYLPFLKAGKILFRMPVVITWSHLIAMFRDHFLGAIKLLGMLNLAGIVSWLLFAIILGFPVYYLCFRLLIHFLPRRDQ